MNRRTCIGACLFAVALVPVNWAREQPERKSLKEFYIAIDAVSDAGPFWFKYVLHVEPVAEGTRVRYMRVAPGDAQCSEIVTVKAATELLREAPVWKLTGRLNLCTLTEGEVDAAIRPYRYPVASIWDTAAYGIVAKCGSSEKLLKLPYTDAVDFDRLTKNEPRVKALYNLAFDVIRRAFGKKSPLHELSKEQEVQVQELGKQYLEELRSGRFDRGFWKPIGPEGSRHFSMLAALEDYRGIYLPTPREGRLVGAEDLQFIKYVPPRYSPMAQMARVQGTVTLEITASPHDGSVKGVKVLSGHEILRRDATEAAGQWIFRPGQEKLSAPITVTLEFSFQCPEL